MRTFPRISCILFAAVVLSGLPTTALAAEPASSTSTRKYVIPAGPLDHALSAFAAAAGIPLSFDPALVAGKTSPGLNGNYSAQEGFTRLLENSSLELAPREGGYTLRPQQHSTLHPLKPATLAEVPVTLRDEEENAWAPVEGYVAKRSATATKTDTPINETPQSISVVTREQMQAQGASTVEQSLRYTAGVMTEGEGYGNDRQYTTIRGFRASYYLDGLKSFVASDLNDWVAEPWSLERVEVLKGPSSVMYGQGEPGGIINQVSKRPSATSIREVQMLVGSYDRYQVAMDVGGKVDEEGALLYRVLSLARTSGTQMPYGQDDRLFLAPMLTIKASPATTLTVMADVTQDRSMPRTAIRSNAYYRIPDNFYVGEPGLDHYHRDLASVGYLFEQDLGADWLFRQSMRYSRNELDYGQVAVLAVRHSVTLDRFYSGREALGHATTLDNTLQKRLITGDVTHQLLLGLDYQDFSGTDFDIACNVPDLDLLNPVYGRPFGRKSRGVGVHSAIQQNGVYLQDQLRMGQWLSSLRVRRDKAYTEAMSSSETNAKNSYQAGLLYASNNGLSPYISYATSFAPKADFIEFPVNGSSILIKPETGRQLEIGVKYQPANADTLLTASLFNLHKQDVRGTDTFIGEGQNNVRSRGFELEAKSSLGRQWDLIGAYTYLDSELAYAFPPNSYRGQYVGTARHAAAVWLDYKFPADASGWSLGGGLRYSDKISCSSFSNCFTPGYTVADAALRYSKGAVSSAVNISNLFDQKTEIYASDPVFYGSYYYNQRRTIQATLSYGW